MAIQLLRFNNPFKEKQSVWVNPAHIIYAEIGEKKDTEKKTTTAYTVLHVAGKEGKVFVKEHPDEINRILQKHKREMKIEY